MFGRHNYAQYTENQPEHRIHPKAGLHVANARRHTHGTELKCRLQSLELPKIGTTNAVRSNRRAPNRDKRVRIFTHSKLCGGNRRLLRTKVGNPDRQEDSAQDARVSPLKEATDAQSKRKFKGRERRQKIHDMESYSDKGF